MDPPSDPVVDPAAQAEGRNPEVDFHGQKRSNATHASTTDPEARLARKSNHSAAKLCFAGHVLIENRNGLIVDMDKKPTAEMKRRRVEDGQRPVEGPPKPPRVGTKKKNGS